MFPAMCRNPPCMNIEVKRVSHQGASIDLERPEIEFGLAWLRATASA